MAVKNPGKVVTGIASVLEAREIRAQPIEGGPVAVPLERAAALWLLPWMCEPECRVGVRLQAGRGKPKALFASWEDTRYALEILRELSGVLAQVKSGTLELLAASTAELKAKAGRAASSEDEGDEDEDEEAGDEGAPDAAAQALLARRDAVARFRLEGVVEAGAWQISAAYPPVTAQQLRSALEVLDLVDGSSTRWAHDEAEAQAVAELAARSTSFIRTNPAQVNANALSLQGAEITVRDDKRPALAMIVLRQRTGDAPWDLRTHQTWDEKWLADYLESLRVMNERMQKLREKYHAPRLSTLLETPTATYFETDFKRVLFADVDGASNVVPLVYKRIDVHYQAEMPFAEAIPRLDEAFGALGYRHLGDYQHSRGDRREAYRVFGGKPGGSVALWGLVAGAFNMQWMFYSLRGKDFWLTTATYNLPASARRPPRSSHRGVGRLTLAEQEAEHQAHLAQHAGEGDLHPTPATMAEYLRFIDGFNAALYG